MKLSILLLAILAAGCAANVDEKPGPEPDKPGLVLRVEMLSPNVLMAGQSPVFKVTLANTSATDTFRAVRPGDGSESGWREPHVHWTGTIDRGDGKPSPLPKWTGGRCGLFEADWDKDFVRLEPGEELPMEWFEPDFELQRAGKVRLQAHYDYRAGRNPLSRTVWKSPYPHHMQGVEPFSVVSEPVEFEMIRPLDLQVTVKKPLKAGVKNRLSEILDVRLVNRTKATIKFDSHQSYQSASLYLSVGRESDESRPETTADSMEIDVPNTIGAGAAVSLVQPSLFAGGFDGTWVVENPGTVRIRALCISEVKGGDPFELLSEWVEVPVHK